MTCTDTARLADLVADGGLDLEARAHIAQCGECRTVVRLLRAAKVAYCREAPASERSVERALQTVMDAVGFGTGGGASAVGWGLTWSARADF